VAFADQFIDQHQNPFARTFRDRLHYRFERGCGSGADQAAHRVGGEVVGSRGNRLVEDGKRVAHRSVACFGEQGEGVFVGGMLSLATMSRSCPMTASNFMAR